MGPELGRCVIFKVNTTIESNHAGCGFLEGILVAEKL